MRHVKKVDCFCFLLVLELLSLGSLLSQSQAKGREGFVDVPGGKVWYRITGEGRTRTPLITLHGGPGAPHTCLEVLETLADERPVVVYDQLGSGKSDRPTDKSLWTVERFTRELAAVRKALGFSRVHILGHSWGTMVTVDYMLTMKPEGVRSLVLSGPCFDAERWAGDQRAYLREFPEKLRKVIEKSESEGKYDSPEYQAAVMQFYRRHLCRLDPWPACLLEPLNMDVYGYMWGPSEFTVTGTLKEYDRTDRLHEIKVPVLFTCGRHDEATPETTRYYQSLIPGSKLLILESASHMHMNEKPAEYVKAIRKFLASVEPQG